MFSAYVDLEYLRVAEFLRRNDNALSRTAGFLRQLKNSVVISFNVGLVTLQADLEKVKREVPEVLDEFATETFLKNSLGMMSVEDCHSLLLSGELQESDVVRVQAATRLLGREHLPHYGDRVRVVPDSGSCLELVEDWLKKGEATSQGRFSPAALVSTRDSSQKVIKVLFKDRAGAQAYFDGYDEGQSYDYVNVIGYVTSAPRYCSTVESNVKTGFSDRALIVCQMDGQVSPA